MLARAAAGIAALAAAIGMADAAAPGGSLPVRSVSVAAASGLPSPASASAAGCGSRAWPGQWRLRFDNDSAAGQDQGYSSGVMVDWSSRPAAGWAQACLPAGLQALLRPLERLRPAGEDVTVSVYGGQGLFTPTSRRRRDIVRDDRPYAAVLLAGVGFGAREGKSYRRTDLQMGIVGPAALGRQTQDLTHVVLGMDRFHGWSNQLGGEPVLQLGYARFQRWTLADSIDLTGGLAGRLGNFATDLTASLDWRFGALRSTEFGGIPVRAGNGLSAPAAWSAAPLTGIFGFLSMAGRFVARDLTLDGSTFRDSHRVDRHRGVAEIGYGLVLTWDEWTLALGRFHRSREFRGQRVLPVYGSLSLGRRF